MASYADLYETLGIDTYKRDESLREAITLVKKLAREKERREGRLMDGYNIRNKTKKIEIIAGITEVTPGS